MGKVTGFLKKKITQDGRIGIPMVSKFQIDKIKSILAVNEIQMKLSTIWSGKSLFVINFFQ